MNAKEVARVMNEAMKYLEEHFKEQGVEFVVLAFDNPEEDKFEKIFATYISSAKKEVTLAIMKQFIDAPPNLKVQ